MRTKLYPWLLPAALILFLIQAVLFPLMVGFTYAGRSESPGHVLTYTTGALTWDSATGVDPDTGAAELSLFSETDQNVQSDNGEKVVAPGTERTNVVRLKNNVSRTITYVAVMYRVKEEADLPVEPVLLDSAAFTDTDTYPLPDGVTEDQVVRAVTGTVAGGQLQDFDISWSWSYYENDQRDQVDTALGNRAAWQEADRVTAGLYIVVVEEDEPVDPDPGETDTPDPTDSPGTPDETDTPDPTDSPGTPDETDTPDPTDSPGTPDETETPPPADTPNGSPTPEPRDKPGGSYTIPDVPKTGNNSHVVMYLVLMAVSGVVLVLLVLDRRREKDR